MHNTCITSTLSVRAKGSLSFAFDDYTYCSNERFVRNPFAYSVHTLPGACCCCCANSVFRVPISSVSCNSYGLRQSTLIQRSAYRKLILGSIDQCYYTRLPVYDVERSYCYDKVNNFREKIARRREGRLRQCLAFGRSERLSLGGLDEAEAVLSLLTEEIDGGSCSSSEESERLVKKIVEKKGRGGTKHGYSRNAKEKVDLCAGSASKYEYQSVVSISRDGDKRWKEESIRKNEERQTQSRKKKQKVRAREGKTENLLRRESGKTRVKEVERHILMGKGNQMMRARGEVREEFLTQEEPRQRMWRDGSSCSSCYSLYSTGEYDSENEIEDGRPRIEGEPSSGYGKHSTEKTVSEEVGEDFDRRKEYGEHQVELRNGSSAVESCAAASGVESDFRKKSEKKLADISVEDVDLRRETVHKESRLSEHHDKYYSKVSGSYNKRDDITMGSTSVMKIDEELKKQQQGQTHDEISRQFETRMKYKRSVDMPEIRHSDMETFDGSQKVYSDGKRFSTKVTSLSQQARGERLEMSGRTSKEDEYQRNSQRVDQSSDIQEIDIGQASTSQHQSESSLKKEGYYSTAVLSSMYEREKQRQLSDQDTSMVDPGMKSHPLTEKETTSILQEQSHHGISKHEEDIHLNFGSYVESKKKMTGRQVREIRRVDSTNGSGETVIGSITHGDTHTASLREGNTSESVTLTTPPSSQLIARVPLRVGSTSGLATKEVSGENSQIETVALHKRGLHRSPALHDEYDETKRDDSYGQPLKFISPEDAMVSAEQLHKSSEHYVGEFVEKVSHDFSSSQVQKENNSETMFVYEEENRKGLSRYSSGDSQAKEHESKLSSHRSGTKGPSDEMWDVDEPSSRVSLKVEVPADANKDGDAIIRRTGRSLWNIIGDIVHLRWSFRSDSRSTGGKSGGKISPNQSTSSEAWFSGHEAEEIEEVKVKNEKRRGIQESKNGEQQEKMTSSHIAEGSSSSKTEDRPTHVGLDTSSSSVVIDGSSAYAQVSSTSAGEPSKRDFEGITTLSARPEPSIPLPAIWLRRDSVSNEISPPEEKDASGSRTSEQWVPTASTEVSGPEVTDRELKHRKLQRKEHVPKDRFDEWEEAYRLETEQRKIDEMFMREALLEAKKAADNWEVPVGAVLVHDGKIIARGCNLVEELRDSTAHAEMICIREASNILRTWRLSETTLYVTLEPCPMCAGAILQARIDTVVWGAPNKLLGADGSWIRLFPNGDGSSPLEQSDKPPAPVHPFHPKITIRRGILASECADAMQQFFQLRRKKKVKKPEPPTPQTHIPISHHPSKFLTKMHNIFNIMFCL